MLEQNIKKKHTLTSMIAILVLLAGVVAPLLSTGAINEMTCAGSVLIIALGLNIIGLSKFKVANYLPVILMPIIICPLYDFIAEVIAKII